VRVATELRWGTVAADLIWTKVCRSPYRGPPEIAASVDIVVVSWEGTIALNRCCNRRILNRPAVIHSCGGLGPRPSREGSAGPPASAVTALMAKPGPFQCSIRSAFTRCLVQGDSGLLATAPSEPGYTRASRDCPIGREPNETDSDFWTRWNLHRAGCFSMLVHDILESESLSLDQLINILIYEPCGQLITMRDWLLSRGHAERLANGIFTTPATETTAVDTPQVSYIRIGSSGRGSSASGGHRSCPEAWCS
jgi:hypothetical protein